MRGRNALAGLVVVTLIGAQLAKAREITRIADVHARESHHFLPGAVALASVSSAGPGDPFVRVGGSVACVLTVTRPGGDADAVVHWVVPCGLPAGPALLEIGWGDTEITTATIVLREMRPGCVQGDW